LAEGGGVCGMEAVRDWRGTFGEVHFAGACLGDARRTRRLVKTADLLMENPRGSLPERLKDWADLNGLYRLADCPAVTHQTVLAPHRQQTLQRMAAAGGPVLILHDSTELDYSDHQALKKLGQIGNGNRRGYICHNSLAITLRREVLGLASQILHVRRQVPAGETPRQKREHPRRESRLWLAACQAIGPSPAGCFAVDICDRGADTFEFLSYEHEQKRHYVVRSAKDRKLAGEEHLGSDRIHQKLHEYAHDLPVLGEREVQVHANRGRHKQVSRTARVAVRAGAVTLKVPHFVRGESQMQELSLWAISVKEIDPPAGREAVEWVLLTDLSAETFQEACERIDWYCCRIVIEEFHRGMKSGSDVEELQFEAEERLEPVIALLSVVTAMLLNLRQLAREEGLQQTPAREIVPLLHVRVLSGWRYRQVRDDLTVLEFTMALGKLGGHLNRKGDGFPGWLTMWRGWRELLAMVRGAEAIGRKKCVER
jgi:hypothetical protein